MISRREVITGALAGSAAVVLGTVPKATAEATLDAAVRVLEAARDLSGDIGFLTVVVTNTRPAGGEPFVPVPHVWGLGRQTQMAWPPARGAYPTLAPGESATLVLDAPGEDQSVRLIADKPAMVRVFARGTERRAETRFVPEDHVDPAV